MGLKDKSESTAAMAGSWPGATIITSESSSSPPSPATLSVNVNIKRNPSLKKLLKLPIFGGSGNSGNNGNGGGGKWILFAIAFVSLRIGGVRRE